MQKSCFLGPTIFEIPQPNWYYWLLSEVWNIKTPNICIYIFNRVSVLHLNRLKEGTYIAFLWAVHNNEKTLYFSKSIEHIFGLGSLLATFCKPILQLI